MVGLALLLLPPPMLGILELADSCGEDMLDWTADDVAAVCFVFRRGEPIELIVLFTVDAVTSAVLMFVALFVELVLEVNLVSLGRPNVSEGFFRDWLGTGLPFKFAVKF